MLCQGGRRCYFYGVAEAEDALIDKLLSHLDMKLHRQVARAVAAEYLLRAVKGQRDNIWCHSRSERQYHIFRLKSKGVDAHCIVQNPEDLVVEVRLLYELPFRHGQVAYPVESEDTGCAPSPCR